MPRSVNAVAAKARRRGYKSRKRLLGRRKNVHTVAKNAVEKAMQVHTLDVNKRKEASALYGFKELTLGLENTV